MTDNSDMTRSSVSGHRERGNIGGWLILGVIFAVLIGGGTFWIGGFGSKHPTAQHASTTSSTAR